MIPGELDWQIRRFVYEIFVKRARPPDIDAVAARFDLSAQSAAQAIQRLHAAHALVLEAGSGEILMAPPLSAVATDYRVLVKGVWLYASCAWDSLGIPAMLNCDAVIEARHPLGKDRYRYRVRAGALESAGVELVHFVQPFRHWYDDIVDT